MKTIFFLSFFMLLGSVYAQNTHEHYKTHQNKSSDSAVKMVDHFTREDGNGDAIIIQRDRDDANADQWFQHYLTVTRHEIAKNLKQTKASGCSNLDFENGDFTGWTCQTGFNYGYPAGSWTTSGPVATRHTIVSDTSGNDPYGGFPMLAPDGGTFSVKLGNDDINYEAEQLIYTFVVQPQDTNFIYKYAVVLQDPGHTWSEQPYFEIKLFDGNDSLIPCGNHLFTASNNIPGFQTSTIDPIIKYKSWTTTGLNLAPYIGQTITIVVTSADCSQGGHFGYGYIDFICPFSFSTTPHVFCNNITSTTLTIPNADPDMLFQWSTGDTTSSITINPQLYAGSTVNCYIASLTSVGLCGFWYVIPIDINHIDVDFTYNTQCYTVDFTDMSSSNSESIQSWQWDFGDGTTSTLQNPSHTYTNASNYLVTLTVISDSCQNQVSMSHSVFIGDSSLIIQTIPDSFYCVNSPIQLFITSYYQTYLWSTNDTTPSIIISQSEYGIYTYYVTVTDSNNCTFIDSISLNIGCNEINKTNVFLPIVSPNPFQNVIHINFLQGNEIIKLYSFDSKLVLEYKNNLSQNTDLDLFYIKPGLYFLEINDSNKNYHFKLIKNKN